MDKISGFLRLLGQNGFCGLFIKWIEKKENPIDIMWRTHKHSVSEEELQEQKQQSKKLLCRPLISVVVPTFYTKPQYLEELFCSLLNQSYGKWELIIADATEDDSVCNNLAELCERYRHKGIDEAQIVYKKLEGNRGISNNTNVGLKLATGDYVAFVDHDDVLEPNALYEMALVINERKPAIIYSDEDKVSEDGKHFFEPHFKSDYNEELLNHYNYVGHLLLVEREVLRKVGYLKPEFDGAQDYDLVMRVTEVVGADAIAHVPKVLYHWRTSADSTALSAGNKEYAIEAQEKVVASHFSRVLVQDKEPREYIIFSSKTVRPLDMEWDKILAVYMNRSLRPVGMVGGRIIDKPSILRGVVECCGYRLLEDGAVETNFYGLNAFKKGYFQRAYLPQNMSGGSLDFCIVDREAFFEVGGFDQMLPPPYRDMDFCLKLKAAGYSVVIDPQVTAVRDGRIADEKYPVNANDAKKIFFARWSKYISQGDAFFNENIRCDGYV